jgi:hypothetical protein
VGVIQLEIRVKPWQFRGRRMERNAPRGYRCDQTCAHPLPAQGTKTCLCTVCHEVFSTPNNFDRHRRDGWCLAPSSVGLRTNERGIWVGDTSPEELNRLTTLFRGDGDE